MTSFAHWLRQVGAHNDVVEWAQPYEADLARLWSECPRGDWLLAIAARLGVEQVALVRAAGAVARLSLDHLPEDDTRPDHALDAVEAWCRGELAADACMERKQAIEASLEQAPDPASSAATIAVMCAIDSIEDAEAAANAAAFAIQAAVLDAGDCAMMEAMRFAQRRSAELVREAITPEAIGGLWPAAAR